MQIGSKRNPLLVAIALLPVLVTGCKVVSIEADREMRERRSEAFDAKTYVDRAWTARILPELDKSTVDFAALDNAVGVNLDQAGEKFGRKASDGAPWTFVVRATGAVSAVNRASRSGTIELAVPVAGGKRTVILQTGPVIVETAIRDSLPFVSFNDFSDQIAYANVGSALTRRALADTKAATSAARVGDRLSFTGVAHIAAAGEPIRVTPVRVQPATGSGG